MNPFQSLGLALPLLAMPFIFAGCAPANAAGVVRVEAETTLAAGDVKVLDLPDASGGKAVSIARDWQPLLVADVPATGEAFSVWLRYKDAPLLAKADLPGGQKDLGWLWDKPAQLSWKRVGRFARAELGPRLVVIRGGDGGQGPVLDCALFATDEAYDPNNAPGVPANAPGVPANAPGVPANAPVKTGDANPANLGDGAAVALGMKNIPDGTLFKASEYSTGSVVDAPGALEGIAVSSKNDWQPLVSIPLPAGDAFKVWVRHKGGPFAIKTRDGDRWTWNKPDRFEWRETDVFSRADLGEKLVIARDAGGDKANAAQIDAVVLSPAQKRELPPEKPDANAPAQTVNASVDWNTKVGTMPREMWGVNDQQSFDSPSGPTPKYQKLFAGLNAPIVRLHQADLVAKLTDEAKRDWDEAKVKAMFERSRQLYGSARIMLNINALPSWIAGGKPEKMSEADEDAFALFCARLVLLAKTNNARVALWEVLNEWDTAMEGAGRLPSLWRTWNKSAIAMRKVDASAKIGGPALTWGKPEWVRGFLQNCPSAQFLSYHNYGTSDVYESNEALFQGAQSNIGYFAKDLSKIMAEEKKQMPLYLTEVNVKYTWDPFERRHQNSVGAIFLALSAKHAAQNGLSGMTLWAQKGKSFGSLIDGDDQPRAFYELYRLGNRSLFGSIAQTRSDNAKALELLAVTKADGSRAVLLVNQTRGDIVVPGAGKWIAGARIERITADGTSPAQVAGTDVLLPGYSMALLSAEK